MHCKYCLGTNLRPVLHEESGKHIVIDNQWVDKRKRQCMSCFSIGRPIAICPQPICPICADQTLDASCAPIINEATRIRLVADPCIPFIAVCTQCHHHICWKCAERARNIKCQRCMGIMRVARVSNIWCESMGDQLRLLLANYAIYAFADSPEIKYIITAIMCEYMKWLSLAKQTPRDPYSIYDPPAPIEAIWRHHIQYTKNYAAICALICGEFIHFHKCHNIEGARVGLKKATIDKMRRIEPFTIHTSRLWECAPQSSAYNLAPTGSVFICDLSGHEKEVPYHPQYTADDLCVYGELHNTICWQGTILMSPRSLESYGIMPGYTLHMI